MSDRVFVYQLFEQTKLDALAERLGGYLAAVGPGRPIEAAFEALPDGGFRYADNGRFSRGDAPDLLATNAEAARREALAFMRGVNEAAARDAQRTGRDPSHEPRPFPVDFLVPGGTRRVRVPNTKIDDHWLTCWRARLPVMPGPRTPAAPVVGATIEVRVGARGQVVMVVSRVRPWQAAAMRPAYTWKPNDEGGKHHDEKGRAHEPPALIYLSDNPGEPQRFLSPCFLVPPSNEEHRHGGRRLFPACDHTVLPEIIVRERRGERTAIAIMPNAQGTIDLLQHGRDWRLTWSLATLSDFISGEMATSEGTSLSLPGMGLFQIAVLVENRRNGAIRSTHRQIAAGPPPDPGAVREKQEDIV